MGTVTQLTRKIERLQSELETRDKLLSSFHKISGLLTRSISLDKILNAIVEETAHVFGVSRVNISLVSKANNNLLECKYVIGFTPEEEKRALSIPYQIDRHDCVETRTVKFGKTIYVKDYTEDFRLTDIDYKLQGIYNRVSGIAAPLKIKKEVIGFIGADKTNEKLNLTRNEIKLFSTFANQASIIIENARLYEQIIAERNFAENILESSPNAVITISQSGRISMVNKTAETLFGLERNYVTGKKASAILQKGILDFINPALRGDRGSETGEVRVKGNNGPHLTLEVSTSFIRSRDRQEMDLLLLARDLTEAKKAEEVMRRMDRLTSLGQLSAGIAHEIRNPLASINLNVQMLSKKLTLDDRTRAVFADTLTGISRIKRLIRGIHDFAKPGTPSLKKGCINDIILDSVALLDSQLKKRKISVSADTDEHLPTIVFDPLKMQQVFINLFINAMDAMPEGGVLNIRTGVVYNMNTDKNELTVHIADNGIGIDPGNLSKIFDPFFTTKPEGTGLGLSITCKILEQHNAIIETESTEGNGTTFIVRFPLFVDVANHV